MNSPVLSPENIPIPADTPRIVAVAPQVPLAEAAASLILARYKTADASPESLTKPLILVPTRRAARALREAMLRQTGGKPLLLPRIQPIGEAAEDEMVFAQLLSDPESTERLLAQKPAMELPERQLRMTELLKRLDKGLPLEQITKLALALLEVLDECARFGCTPESLKDIVPEALAMHWQKVLQVLRVIWEFWPAIIAESGAMEPVQRRDALLRMLIAHWERMPPDFPVIAVGSFGTQASARELLVAIANLPEGLLLINGIDATLADDAWDAVDETHHAFALKKLLDKLAHSRTLMPRWGDASPRAKLWQEVLLPATCTEQWREPKLSMTELQDALAGTHRILAPNVAIEAQCIALLLREVLETPAKTAALVTNNRQLAAQVQSALAAMEVSIDDSAGMPLLRTAAGRLVQLVMDAANARFAPIDLLAMLRHPLVHAGQDRGAWLFHVRQLERHCLRGLRPGQGLTGLRDALQRIEKETLRDELATWLDGVIRILQPLEDLFATDAQTLADCMQVHLQVTEQLTTTADGAVLLWEKAESPNLARALEGLKRASPHLAPLAPAHYPPMLVVLLAGEVWRPTYGMHPRLQILSPQEARLQQFDRLIIGGLNEGSWPQNQDSGPWLSRPMRAEAGLGLTEESLGAQSLDFLQLVLAPEVFLTLSAKQGSAVVLPSRYLQRLDAVLQSYSAQGNVPSIERADVLDWADAMMQLRGKVEPASRPQPRPPVSVRPRKLAVTRIDRLLTDPYSIYAMYILGLRELEALDTEPEATQLGLLMHEVMENLTREFPHGWHPEIPSRFDALAEEALGQWDMYPLLQTMARERIARLRVWLLPLEKARREQAESILPEQKLEYTWASTAGDFTLSARVDRAELLPDGGLNLVDYKSSLPKVPDIMKGKKNQLPLEGWMVEQGAWEGRRHALLELWELKAADAESAIATLADICARSRAKPSPEALIEEAGQRVKGLVAAFDEPKMPYSAAYLPPNASYGLEYAHLARMGEWE